MTQWFWGKSERPHSQEGSRDFTAQITLTWLESLIDKKNSSQTNDL